jgi:CDP-glucose 4,6-dehydratase
MINLFNNIYFNKKVFITGHTGFKGSWLAFWLEKLGSEVFGFSLEAPTKPNHIDLLDLNIHSMIADIRDADVLYGAMSDFQPDIVFHLAAQSLVRESYQDPVGTFDTNVMGTLNVFEACRKVGCIKAILNITSDKCYENRERRGGYREDEPMGGYDPYSCSKGCAELLTASYRNSFFPLNRFGHDHQTLLASCRAGNVVGGGDWAVDRLIPDVMRAVEKKEKVMLRNPKATRPWQHVLEPLSGYLLLGQHLLEGKADCADGWNFGPKKGQVHTVESVIKKIAHDWDKVDYAVDLSEHPHEAGLLQLNCDKAAKKLKWKEVWDINQTIDKTITWYKAYYESGKVLTESDLNTYISDACARKMAWTL